MHKVASLCDKIFELQMSPSFFFKRACVLIFLNLPFELKLVVILCEFFFESGMERKEHRSGRCHRTEPEGLDLALRDEGVRKAFKDAGCWNFCEKLQGGHVYVTKEFALNFTGLNSKVSML